MENFAVSPGESEPDFFDMQWYELVAQQSLYSPETQDCPEPDISAPAQQIKIQAASSSNYWNQDQEVLAIQRTVDPYPVGLQVPTLGLEEQRESKEVLEQQPGPSVASTFQDGVQAVMIKESKPARRGRNPSQTPRTRPLRNPKPKMWQQDPEVNPKAKMAIASHKRRENHKQAIINLRKKLQDLETELHEVKEDRDKNYVHKSLLVGYGI